MGALRSGRMLAVRTVVFGAMAAGILLCLALGLVSFSSAADARRRAELYRGGGDTFVRMFYLARASGREAESGYRFLEEAERYYRVSAQADPFDVRTSTSLALTLAALERKEDAEALLRQILQQEMPQSQRNALTATFSVVFATRPRAEYVEIVAEFLRGFPPGPIVLARAYETIGNVELAEEEWSRAEEQTVPLVRRMAVMLVVCGLMLLAGAAGLIAAVVSRFRRRATGPAAEAGAEAKWGVREAAEALILWLFVAVVVGVLLRRGAPGGARAEIAYQVLPSIAGGVAAIVWVWMASPRGARLGWSLARWWRRIAVGLSAAGIVAIPIAGLYAVLQRMQLRLGAGDAGGALPDEHPLVPVFAAERGWEVRVLLVVVACVVAPVLEETLFRGILYRALRRRWSFAPAALVSAAVFAVGHLIWIGIVPYVVLGIVFAYLYERWGSLLVPWAAHAAFNAFNLAILLALFG